MHFITPIIILFFYRIDESNSNELDLKEPDERLLLHFMNNHKRLMNLTLISHQIYTAPEMINVIDREKWNFNLEGDLSLLTNPTQLYKGTAAVFYHEINVVERKLGDILNEAILKRKYIEGMLWFRNVIESVGISVIIRFCDITIRLINTKKFKSINLEDYLNMFQDLQKIFNFHMIRTEPVDKMINMINYLISTENRLSGKFKYLKDCYILKSRFMSCVNLVEVYNFNDIGDSEDTTFLNTKLELIFPESNLIDDVSQW